jgi:hypothetical protein
MYIDEIDYLLNAMRRRLRRVSSDDQPITAVSSPFSSVPEETVQTLVKTTAEEAIDRAIASITAIPEDTEMSSSGIEETDGATGDAVGDGGETDDEEGIAEGDVTTSPNIRRGHVSDTVRVMEEIMGDSDN